MKAKFAKSERKPARAKSTRAKPARAKSKSPVKSARKERTTGKEKITVELDGAERFFIQRSIERTSFGHRTNMEKRLMDKVS